MIVELDHIFCMVSTDGQAARRLEDAGWILDSGIAHPGQGTANSRVAWSEQYLELLWIANAYEARANPLRLDRRADWRTTNASPFGFAFRGHVPEDDRAEYWLYDALGFPIWIHRDNERSPERPMVFILETADNEFEQRRPRTRTPGLLAHPTARELRAVDVSGPAPAKLPAHAGPLIRQTPGPHRLQIVVGDAPVLDITEILHIRG